jgi:hypothetical protein
MRPLLALAFLGLCCVQLSACDQKKSSRDKDDDDDGKSRKDRDDDDDGKTRKDRDDDDDGKTRKDRDDDDDGESRKDRDDDDDEKPKRREVKIRGEECSEGVSIEKVVLSRKRTVIYFEIDEKMDGYFVLGPGEETAFQLTDIAARSEGIYHLVGVRGVPTGEPLNATDYPGFQLEFPPLPSDVEEIYLTEGNTWDVASTEGLWRCDDVMLK